MKKFVFLLGLLFALQTQPSVMAQQTDQEVVVFNAHLLQTFSLNIDSVAQEITFAVAADYNNGVTEAGGIDPGFTDITVEATGNWNLQIDCPDFQPVGPEIGSILINNLGVWCEATGTYVFGDQVLCNFQSASAALGLSIALAELIGLGPDGNGGDISDNAFRLHWLMGTRQGSMHQPETMFDQMTAGLFGTGDYTTIATLTLTQIP